MNVCDAHRIRGVHRVVIARAGVRANDDDVARARDDDGGLETRRARDEDDDDARWDEDDRSRDDRTIGTDGERRRLVRNDA